MHAAVPGALSAHALDLLQVDDVRTVDSHELLRGQELLDLLHRAAHEIDLPAGNDLDIIPSRTDVLHAIDGNELTTLVTYRGEGKNFG